MTMIYSIKSERFLRGHKVRENSVPYLTAYVDRSGRTFALAEIRTCPLSTPKVANVQISASPSRVPPLAELNEMVQYVNPLTV